MSSHRQQYRRQPRRPLAALVLISILVASLPATGAHAICNPSPAGSGFEFVAALFDANLQCSGTVLPGGWILPAAHCGNVGHVALPHRPGQLAIAECWSHPQFNETTLENDIAMLRIANPPAGLQGLPPVASGWVAAKQQPLTIAGWSGCAVLAPTLGRASVMAVPVDACIKQYQMQKSDFVISPAENLCTEVGKSRVFNADSGGPVIVQLNGQPRLAGGISVDRKST